MFPKVIPLSLHPEFLSDKHQPTPVLDCLSSADPEILPRSHVAPHQIDILGSIESLFDIRTTTTHIHPQDMSPFFLKRWQTKGENPENQDVTKYHGEEGSCGFPTFAQHLAPNCVVLGVWKDGMQTNALVWHQVPKKNIYLYSIHALCCMIWIVKPFPTHIMIHSHIQWVTSQNVSSW